MGLANSSMSPDALEAPYGARQDLYRGMQKGLNKGAVEARQYADRTSGGNWMGGFEAAEAGRRSELANLSANENAVDHNLWAAGREIQHDRNLENFAADTARTSAEGGVLVGLRNAEANSEMARGLSQLGNNTVNVGGMGPNSASITTMDSAGNRTGGGSVSPLAGLRRVSR